MPTQTTITTTGGPKTTKRKLRLYKKTALSEAIDEWHEKRLPDHFRPKATGLYRYKMRSRKYEEKKRRIHHHSNPLVYSGETRFMATRSIQITATAKGVTGRIQVPKYIYMRRLGQPDLASELTRITRAELKTIMAGVEASLVEQINGEKERTVEIV